MNPIITIEDCDSEKFRKKCKEVHEMGYKLSSSTVSQKINGEVVSGVPIYEPCFCAIFEHDSEKSVTEKHPKIIEVAEYKILLLSILNKLHLIENQPPHRSYEDIARKQEKALIEINKMIRKVVS